MKKPRNPKVKETIEKCRGNDGMATRQFIDRIGDKWSILIVMVLSHQPGHRARFSDLKHGIEGISQTMLTSTLRALERDGFVEREIFPEVPPRVEYELTKFGESVLEPMKALAEWATRNWAAVEKSREKFDAKEKAKGSELKTSSVNRLR